MRILYVEDNPANLFLVQRVARMGNHEVIHYAEGQPALDNFEKDNPDLVLMDIQLPGMLTGLDVVKALRAAGHKTPIIAVTAYAMSGDREKCLEAGCDAYLAKPLPVGELVELFRRYEPAAKPAEAVQPVTAPPPTPVAETAQSPNGSPSQAAPVSENKPTDTEAPETPARADNSGDETIPSRPTLQMRAATTAEATPAPPQPATEPAAPSAPQADAATDAKEESAPAQPEPATPASSPAVGVTEVKAEDKPAQPEITTSASSAAQAKPEADSPSVTPEPSEKSVPAQTPAKQEETERVKAENGS